MWFIFQTTLEHSSRIPMWREYQPMKLDLWDGIDVMGIMCASAFTFLVEASVSSEIFMDTTRSRMKCVSKEMEYRLRSHTEHHLKCVFYAKERRVEFPVVRIVYPEHIVRHIRDHSFMNHRFRPFYLLPHQNIICSDKFSIDQCYLSESQRTRRHYKLIRLVENGCSTMHRLQYKMHNKQHGSQTDYQLLMKAFEHAHRRCMEGCLASHGCKKFRIFNHKEDKYIYIYSSSHRNQFYIQQFVNNISKLHRQFHSKVRICSFPGCSHIVVVCRACPHVLCYNHNIQQFRVMFDQTLRPSTFHLLALDQRNRNMGEGKDRDVCLKL